MSYLQVIHLTQPLTRFQRKFRELSSNFHFARGYTDTIYFVKKIPVLDSTNFTGYGISYWCDDGEGFLGRGTFGSLGLQKVRSLSIADAPNAPLVCFATAVSTCLIIFHSNDRLFIRFNRLERPCRVKTLTSIHRASKQTCTYQAFSTNTFASEVEKQ